MDGGLLGHRLQPVEMEHPMKARVRTVAAAGLVLAGAGAAGAGEPVFERDVAAAVLVTGFDGVSDPTPVTARVSAFGQAGWLFENQVEAGVGLGLVAERDDPTRDPRGGRAGDCAPAQAGCASLGGQPLRGFVSGYVTAGPTADEGVRLALESAYFYVRNGWGEASLGRDQGAARRLSVTPPTILAIGGALDAPVDGTGLGGVVLRNDISGQSAKLFVATTRVVGLQAAVSYTPEIEHEGIDQGYRERAAAPQVFEPEGIVETSLSFAHTFASGWETTAGLTYAHAEDNSGRASFGAMNAWSAGATLAKNGWSAGVSWLQNDNGWSGRGRNYTAAGISAVREQGDWAFMLEAGTASDNLTYVDIKTVSAAARRRISPHLALAGGANWADRTSPVGGGAARAGRNEDGFGAFLEISYAL